MNKTETLLWLMRAHEAVRRLPEGTDINSIDVTLYGDGNRIRLFLNGDTDIRNIVSKTVSRYSSGDSGCVEVSDSYGVDYWWGVDFDDDGNIKART